MAIVMAIARRVDTVTAGMRARFLPPGVEPERKWRVKSINHLLAAPELTREQSAICRVKGEKIHIF